MREVPRLESQVGPTASRSGCFLDPHTHPLAVKFGFCSEGLGKNAETGLAQANTCFWKTGPKSAPLSGGASQSKATGVVSGPQEATPWNPLCGPGPPPQQSIPGTNDSGPLEPPNLSINKAKRSPAGSGASSPRQSRHGLEALGCCDWALSGLGHSWLHLAGQRVHRPEPRTSQLPLQPFALGQK